MANLKACVRGSRKDGFCQVYIRVTHQRNSGFIKTDKMVSKKDLTKSKEIKDPFVLKYCSELILRYNALLNMQDISSWTLAQVIDYLTNESDDVCFSDYARTHINRMINCGQERNARNYKMAVQHLELFMGTNKIMFSQMTSLNVNKWVKTLESTKRAKEMYPVCVRQIFKAATTELNDYDNGMIRIKTNPWLKVKIPKSDPSHKRAISPDACRDFFSAPCPETGMLNPTPELGQDVSKMVLCLAGINTVDLYNLQKTNYQDGIICYQRAKTSHSRSDGAYFEMRVEPILMPLFEKYKAADDDPYLFNFHKRYNDSDSFCSNVNTGIKKICKSMGIPQSKWYCVYTWRHSWATIAQNDCDATIEEVGFAMNHSQRSTRVTRGYLKIDFSPAWELNAKVINFIFFTTEKGKQGKARDIDASKDMLFRISPKMMMYARAYYHGELLVELSDIGFNTVDDVIKALAVKLPSFIPNRAAVQFRIKNVDTGKEAVYDRTKGKGF
jgi:integrase